MQLGAKGTHQNKFGNVIGTQQALLPRVSNLHIEGLLLFLYF